MSEPVNDRGETYEQYAAGMSQYGMAMERMCRRPSFANKRALDVAGRALDEAHSSVVPSRNGHRTRAMD